MIKTCLLGLGRTGMVVAEHLTKSAEFELAAVVVKPGSDKVKRRLKDITNIDSPLMVIETGALVTAVKQHKIQVAIDFTNPKAALKNARILAEQGVHLVIGTTGFNKTQFNELKNIAEQFKVGVVYAPNISVGVNILMVIVKTLARLLPAYDVEIAEYHHRHKKDAPSGTAMKLANAIHQVQDVRQPRLVFGRYGATERQPKEIGIHAIRAGGIIGVHKVLFSSSYDEIEVTHRSYSRAVFAEGALKAAKFIADRSGFFNMEEILVMENQEKTVIGAVTSQVGKWWSRLLDKTSKRKPASV